MILGLSLILAFLSYLIYCRLLSSNVSGSSGSSGSSSSTGRSKDGSTSQAIPMWPFMSMFLSQPSPQQTPATVGSSGTVKCLIPQQSSAGPSPAVVVVAPVPALSPTAASPGTTPTATPESPTVHIDAIPQLSLSPNFSINVEDEDDYVPSFPSLTSAQRASGRISPPTSTNSNLASKPPTIISMPPPPVPIRSRNPKANVRYAVPASPSPAASVLRQNPNGAARPRLSAIGVGAAGVAAGNGLNLPNSRGQASSSKSRKKVILEPGHSPLDWARLQRSGIDLRGLPHSNLIKVSPSLLAKHSNAPEDIWTTLNGRVYNITPYLPFHPGGEKDLLRGAGKDSTKLFNATHPWVNVEGMLAECLIGIFASEDEAVASTNGESESTLNTVD